MCNIFVHTAYSGTWKDPSSIFAVVMALPKPSAYHGPLSTMKTEAAYFSGTLAPTYHTTENRYSPI